MSVVTLDRESAVFSTPLELLVQLAKQLLVVVAPVGPSVHFVPVLVTHTKSSNKVHT
jgi:hypothetical protein